MERPNLKFNGLEIFLFHLLSVILNLIKRERELVICYVTKPRRPVVLF